MGQVGIGTVARARARSEEETSVLFVVVIVVVVVVIFILLFQIKRGKVPWRACARAEKRKSNDSLCCERRSEKRADMNKK